MLAAVIPFMPMQVISIAVKKVAWAYARGDRLLAIHDVLENVGGGSSKATGNPSQQI